MAAGEGARARLRREDPSVGLSKALSYVLRHGAVAVGLPMGADGFVEVGALLRLPRFAGVSEAALRRLVAADPKGRFALRADPLRIRANQGHSLQVPALELTPLRTPEELPPTLAHGTRRRLWAPIRAGGLAPMGRTHIHLAAGLPGDPAPAQRTGSGMRLDSEIAIIIDGPRALAEGIPFFRSANGVILTPGDAQGRLPPKYFLRVLQLRPHRCLLPLEGPSHEDGESPLHEGRGGVSPSHEDGESPSHEGREGVSPSHEGPAARRKPINHSPP
ncbi:LOW QUALITY PROTEIN: tRNA 2'-phosphotransferase 1 [Pelecanus crispus]|uniref:LOW QUALITY PROTEIN: tRNA 2'-phosphotransferase 1 n=1 Tax=Pelecanus crispus TaxID=36300 RepID=UPI003F5D20ED